MCEAQRLEVADLGFSTADAEQVRLRYEGGDLTLEFVDWRETPVSVVFQEAVGFRWNDEVEPEVGGRDDLTYVVQGSRWLDSQSLVRGEGAGALQHLRLCFNACGVLDVLCRSHATTKGTGAPD